MTSTASLFASGALLLFAQTVISPINIGVNCRRELGRRTLNPQNLNAELLERSDRFVARVGICD